MPRTFEIPDKYQSDLLSQIKRRRSELDPKKRDKTPTVLELGPVTLKFARHFGFCFGVENAIEIAYRAVEENPDKRIFLLSEMIHNPHVNGDLEAKGVRFLFSTLGEPRFPLDEVTRDDIVIIPAFGTTLEMFSLLQERGIDTSKYNTTCPFVEKVWKRGTQLGSKKFSIIIHGKAKHEETRATFSHAGMEAPSLIVADVEEAKWLKRFILGQETLEAFHRRFTGRCTSGFSPESDLVRIGVINQTTMLATETWEISQILRSAMVEKYGVEKIAEHFADTRDTLCYATSENQEATKELIESGGDIALIVGGYNSSNTSHLVELCQEHFPSYFVKGPEELVSRTTIRHLDLETWEVAEVSNWLPEFSDRPVEVLITSGASCPDALVNAVVERLVGLFDVPLTKYNEAAENCLLKLESSLQNGSSERLAVLG
ncbi:MAG: 4-hydroxy-3-methylbut-2-enyl diphosphate reductase [Bdellovibrionales bacterium]|nr:4-hydroxy-3-methylbut-2-enyl diphosphate reductase [Bdellovibrionales bacterium]